MNNQYNSNIKIDLGYKYSFDVAKTPHKYNPIESAFQTSSTVDTLPVALGPKSRVIGKCQQLHGDSGMCWGRFKSTDVDVRDHPPSCVLKENYVKNFYNTQNTQNTHRYPQKDPSGGLMHYRENTRNINQKYHYKPLKKWNQYSSFGSYSNCSNCSLSEHVGNSILGISATKRN